jgi:glycosyltransferase involved in cell wall biosynthesis
VRNTYEINLLLETGCGGAARHVFDLYRGLKQRGRSVRLILSLRRADPLFLAELASIDPEDVYQIDIRRSPSPEDIVAVVKLRHFLRQRTELQVVHAHSTKAGAISAMLGSDRTATIFTPHAYRGMDTTLHGWQKAIVRAADKFLSNANRKVIASSLGEYRYARSLGISQKRLSLIVYGMDVQGVRDVGRNSRLIGSENACDVGFVGRLAHQKSPLTFLKVLEVMKASGFAFHGHIIGDGPLRPMLEKFARDHQLTQDVTFYGTVNAIPLMANLDLFVHTSIYESFPYSLLEAVALGIPIVAVSNIGSEAILGGRLQLIKGHLKHAEIADAAMNLFRDSAARDKIRATYLDIEKEIELGTMIDKIEAEYDALW